MSKGNRNMTEYLINRICDKTKWEPNKDVMAEVGPDGSMLIFGPRDSFILVYGKEEQENCISFSLNADPTATAVIARALATGKYSADIGIGQPFFLLPDGRIAFGEEAYQAKSSFDASRASVIAQIAGSTPNIYTGK